MRHDLVAGLDEVGMGAIAGPIVVVATAFWTQTPKIEGVADSKKLSANKRLELFPKILSTSRWFGVGYALPATIDEVGLDRAWQVAASLALYDAPIFKELYVDGETKVGSYPGHQVVKPKADALYWQCSAASVVAKVIRDRDMVDLSALYPAYRWDSNVGYGTADHMKGIQKYGVVGLHRKEFIQETKTKGPTAYESLLDSW